ncbi:acyl transferase [Phaeodactylibacter xiamenensis]|uniref:acyl transferase n=1 Tax=Phaeodactylibacter xiamenensis TaxID=1524460 RepID=UPI0024A9C046|nr:acyl transferase [Phaeodactylibacter xiamenensis]
MNYKKEHAALKECISHVTASDFEPLALQVFKAQAACNPLYQRYLELLGQTPGQVQRLSDIPFLPISLFKNHTIQTGEWQSEAVFSSSGTTGAISSKHLLRSKAFYQQSARRGFETFYGSLKNYCVLALLPSYLERSGSSLVFMVEDFIRQSGHPDSGFFLYNTDELLQILQKCRNSQQPTLLIGVSFALLDLAEAHPTDLSGITIMETGGMKGRRRELTREELHAQLRQAFQVEQIHSEYGMTELLSQAYSTGNGLFRPAPTMQVRTREITDPFAQPATGRTGALNIIDLANLDTISFIATDDLGRVYEDGSFEVLGRLDASDVRGCNLMVADLK